MKMQWFRCWHGMSAHAEWAVIAKRAGLPRGMVVSVVLALLEEASQAEDRGSVAAFDFEAAAVTLDYEEEQVRAIYAALEARQFIVAGRLQSWDKHQPKREDSSAERTAAHRAGARKKPAPEAPALPLDDPPGAAASSSREICESDPPADDAPIDDAPTEPSGADEGAAPERSASLVSPEAIKLANDIAVLVGHDLQFVPPAWCGAAYRVHTWLANGWQSDLILESIKGQMARKRDGPPDRIQYFEPGIARAHARASAPIPIASVENERGHHVRRQDADAHSGLAAVDRVFARFGAAASAKGDA